MESLERRYDAIKPHLTERQRRIWLGSEARELGSGGVRVVADAVRVSPDTVRRGRSELDDPATAAGGPLAGSRRWAQTRRGTRPRAARGVGQAGRPGLARGPDDPAAVDVEVVAEPGRSATQPGASGVRDAGGAAAARGRLQPASQLQDPGGRRHPDRDAQFRHIHDTVAAALAAGMPVISVDCKKKELVGQYKNTGQRLPTRRRPGEGRGPRLHRRGGQGDPLRRLRPGRQHRMGDGGHRPRDRRVRGEHPTGLVEHPRPPRLPATPTGC